MFPLGTTTVQCKLPGTTLSCSFTVTVTCNTPTITVKLDSANLTLTWSSSSSSVLQVADTLTGPWTNVPDVNGRLVIDTTASGQKFYRLTNP